MCGILGMVSSSGNGFNIKEQRVFEQLLWAGAIRGDDSTGVFGVSKEGNVDYLKTVGNTNTMISSKEWKEFESDIYSSFQMVVGHNRKATRGATTDENAHPFVEEDCILVHNGTLTSLAGLTDKVTQVDSHAILHSIVERGYKKTLEEIQGAFTLVWYNAKEKVLYLTRNQERPLFIANTSGAWYFASEKGMLDWILEREDAKVADYTEAQPGIVYKFKLDEKGKTMWSEPVKLYQPPKKEATVIPLLEKKELGESEKPDIIAGTKITFSPTLCKKANKEFKGFTHLISGVWFSDPEVKVTCWCNEEGEKLFQDVVDDDDECHLQATVTGVSKRKDTITLLCSNVEPFVQRFDMEQNEILEDDFLFTDKKCSYCDEPVEFLDLEKGVFEYKSQKDYQICCPTCTNHLNGVL